MYQITFRLQSFSLALLFATIGAGLASAKQRTYDMNFTINPPTIDGVVDAGEWEGSSGIESDWTLLRTSASPDAANYAWQGLWGADGLYLLVTSDQSTWSVDDNPRADGRLRFGLDNINFYIDPNQDGEDNVVATEEVEGYQVGFATLLGASAYSDGAGAAVFLEAHVNATAGDQGLWGGTDSFVDGLVDTVMSANTGMNGSVVEVFIPWTDLNAEGGDATAEGMTVLCPAVNATWFFNVAQITSDGTNLLPVWNNSGSNVFAQRQDAATAQFPGNVGGHGEISFVGALSGDTNLDGTVDVLGDAFILVGNLGSESTCWTDGDFDGNGIIDVLGDAFILVGNLGTSLEPSK